ncbi:hypothetical protein GF339_08920, partial [candidate division KSB3 bacterium]|nr:hypothetical protein [candidate division KSB3 bacterium]MBD3324693.1 hypothetical protein [candidate division KSB3 bacterium]
MPKSLLLISLLVGILMGAATLKPMAQELPAVLSLEEAIQFALRHNINLQSARDRVSSANISLESAQSEFQIAIRPELSGLFQQGEDVRHDYGLRISKQFRYGGEMSWRATTSIDDDADEEEYYQTDLTLAYTQPLLKGRGKLPTTQEIVAAEYQTRSQYRTLLL